MKLAPTDLWKLPVPATSLVKGPNFDVLPKRQCEISFQIEGKNGQLVQIGLLFEGVEAFKCTYLTSCTAEMFNLAYGKLVRLGETSWLNELLKSHTNRPQPPSELEHLMICFDDGPCFEIVCLNFEERRSE
jgi:hypothetical protein